MKRLFVLLACLLAIPAQGQILSIIMGGTNQAAATPTFSSSFGTCPSNCAVTNPTTVTASTSTSDGCTIYFDTSNPPVTATPTYSVTTGVTLYAQARGCAHHRDSLVGSATYTISSGPVADHVWQVHAATTTCTSGIACLNTLGIYNVVDSGTGTETDFGRPAGSQQPIYTTAALNSLAVAAFTSASSQNIFNTTGVSGTKFSGMVAFYLNSVGVGQSIMGGLNDGALEWRINTSNHQEILSQGTASIIAGSATFSIHTWYLVAFVCDPTVSGACKVYTCSSGSCSVDGTSSSTSSFTKPVETLGGVSSEYVNGEIPEWLLSASLWTSGNLSTNAAYFHSLYGL